MRPVLLVDRAVADGSAHALPLAWLEGFDLRVYTPRELAAVAPDPAVQAILLRSVSRLTAGDLQNFRNLQGVATLSSGTDHIDVAALERTGVALHTGHGGNAVAVTDWVEWALSRSGRPLAGLRVAVVGVGAVGSLVVQRLQQRGALPLPCDPPRAEREPGFVSRDLDALLQDSVDAVTLHVPLVREGRHATTNLLDAQRLGRLPAATVLNAARGDVLDAHKAAELRRNGGLRWLAIDTFPSEPRVAGEVVAACDLATPHIAGHSVQGKRDVALRAVTGLCRQFGLAPPVVAADPPGPAEWLPLDQVSAALRADPSAFEPLRHGHRRNQTVA
ncbi:MAG: hypothetical protein HY902_02045 [Deltaproteobacteria bacterium]|nr:hypothetical protein [Deltaproteobacteria bacterium]